MASVRGQLFTVSAPSGAGKTSLVDALLAADQRLKVSVSHTTRPMRPGEEDGINYHFVDASTFAQMVNDGRFLEHATVFGNAYGTSKDWVDRQLSLGTDVILEIDWQGAQQTHQWLATELGESGVGIFILPPSMAALQARLTGRGQDDEAVIAGRMAVAVDEMRHYHQADYIIINDDFETALSDLQAVIQAQRLSRSQQQRQYKDLLAALIEDSDQ